mmetsp:Transcript_6515/g.14386  ORF Transcript_6515/g.14386 Transcript_6515/m.14386 type:complete len:146 (-) Transcript_6515:1946-2383(-)
MLQLACLSEMFFPTQACKKDSSHRKDGETLFLSSMHNNINNTIKVHHPNQNSSSSYPNPNPNPNRPHHLHPPLTNATIPKSQRPKYPRTQSCTLCRNGPAHPQNGVRSTLYGLGRRDIGRRGRRVGRGGWRSLRGIDGRRVVGGE